MRLFVLWTALIGLSGYVGLSYMRSHPEQFPAALQLEQYLTLPEQAKAVITEALDRHTAPRDTSATKKSMRPRKVAVDQAGAPRAASASPASHPSSAPAQSPSPANQVTLYLTNGGVITGGLVRETAQEITLFWEGGEVGFQRSEIKRMVGGKASTDDDNMTMPWENAHQPDRWDYQHEVVVKLMKGTVIDGEISAVRPDTVVVSQRLPGGGAIEHTVRRDQIEQLLFKPIVNERSKQIEQTLQTLFPHMQAHTEGLFTILTDSALPTVKAYWRTIRELSTDWYLTFHPLVTGRRPQVQQHLVLFENWDAYIEYAATDGVPGWLAVGYFNPEDQVLYGFNLLGERFSDLLYEVYLGMTRERRDEISAQVAGSRYAEFIEGQMSEYLKQLESTHSMVRQIFGDLGVGILRHELTHGMFHNWRLQGIALSQMAEQDQAEVERKRQYLKAGDVQKKRELLDAMLKQQAQTPLPDTEAANSWFIEGLAGYMEPTPVGAPNTSRLADLQQARARGPLMPLEFLHTFKLGSFLGMSTRSALEAYAQSWALCHFLMHRYPQDFLAYLNRIAREAPPTEDTLTWLAEAVGKDPRALDQEFLVYLDGLPAQEPEWLQQFQFILDRKMELDALANRLWNR